jgi:hypothetical protein
MLILSDEAGGLHAPLKNMDSQNPNELPIEIVFVTVLASTK